MRKSNKKSLLAALAVTIAAQACIKDSVAKTVDEDPSLPSIAIADTRLHAEAFGDPAAPMIVVLHGGPGGDYRSLLPMRALADDGYYVVFWDQRGSGLSRRHGRSTYVMATYLEDLRLVIEHYTSSPRQPIVFIGHSWGAMYATWFINEHGDYGGRIAGAVLSEPGAFTSAGLEAFYEQAPPPDLAWTDRVRSPTDHERADAMARGRAAGTVPTWRTGVVVTAALPALGLRDGFDWTTHLGDFTRPVLFLRGELGFAHQRELASHYANAELITVNGAGHEGIAERSGEFLVHIRAYLAKIDQRSGSSASR